jgi:predicted ferric reductase
MATARRVLRLTHALPLAARTGRAAAHDRCTPQRPYRFADRIEEPPTADRCISSVRPDPQIVCRAGFGLGVAAVVALWWSSGPSADPRLDAARLAGLLAAYLLAVQILLRARLPYVENGVEGGVLARWHRRGGQRLIWLAATHAALVVWAYARMSGVSLWVQARVLLMNYPDVLMATVALALFTGVGLLAARAVRRRVTYQTWSHAHLYVYLAAGLTIAHQLANGEHLHRHPAVRTAWLVGWIGIAGVVLWFRVLTPLSRSVRWRLRVADVRPAAAGVTTVTIAGRGLDRARIEPGQYFRWRFLSRGRWWSGNPYSLSAPPTEQRLRITAKSLGDHSTGLADLAPGTRVVVEGPYGALTARAARAEGAVMIAGGIGITPLRALFESLPATPGQLDLIYRASTAEEVLFRAELEALARRRGGRLHLLIGSRAEHPISAELLRGLVADIACRDAYICGPPGLAAAFRNALGAAGLPRSRIHVEGFALDDV